MKRKINSLKKLLPFFITISILIGCSKEKTEKQATLIQATESEFLVNKVLNFSQMAGFQKEGKLFKNNEKMPIDEALYNISATLNFVYCFHTANYEKLHLETIAIKVPILGQEEKTFLVDALAGFNEAVEKIKTQYEKIEGDNKHLLGCMLKDGVVNRS